MSIGSIQKLDKFVSTTPSLDISQIQSAQAISETELIVEHAAGHHDPQFVAIAEQRPMFRITSTELDTILAAVGVGGAALATGYLYLKAGAATGSVARATTSHSRLLITSGYIFWERISLQHNAVGTIDVVVAANYNGSANPIVFGGSVALSGNLTAASFFGAGPVVVNGSAVTGIKSIEIASGLQLLQEGSGSEVWPTWTSAMETKPSITIQTLVPTNWNTYGIGGTALDSSTGIECYARKFSASGSRVADLTAEHVKFTGADGIAVPENTEGDGRNPVSDTLRCDLVSDSDSNRPLVINTASALP